jgi:hypothetical protein
VPEAPCCCPIARGGAPASNAAPQPCDHALRDPAGVTAYIERRVRWFRGEGLRRRRGVEASLVQDEVGCVAVSCNRMLKEKRSAFPPPEQSRLRHLHTTIGKAASASAVRGTIGGRRVSDDACVDKKRRARQSRAKAKALPDPRRLLGQSRTTRPRPARAQKRKSNM